MGLAPKSVSTASGTIGLGRRSSLLVTQSQDDRPSPVTARPTSSKQIKTHSTPSLALCPLDGANNSPHRRGIWYVGFRHSWHAREGLPATYPQEKKSVSMARYLSRVRRFVCASDSVPGIARALAAWIRGISCCRRADSSTARRGDHCVDRSFCTECSLKSFLRKGADLWKTVTSHRAKRHERDRTEPGQMNQLLPNF
jgi:hypothetical protein